MILRVRPEQVSKLLCYIADVGAASERESLLYGSVPDSETRSCIVGVGITSETRNLLFSSAQLQKQGVVLLTYLQPRTSSCMVCISTASETGGCIVNISAASETRSCIVNIFATSLSCSSFKTIAFSFRTMKGRTAILLTQVAVTRPHSFWSLQHDNACRIYRVRHPEDCFSDFTIGGWYSTDVTSKFIPGMTR